MADENLIGHGACPVCGQPEARYTLTKSRLVCVSCRQVRCGFQGFARTGDCDEKLRALIGTASPAKPVLQPETPAPTAPAIAAIDDAPQKQKTETKRPGWGVLGAI